MDAGGLLEHTTAKSPDDVSKAYKLAFVDFSSRFNTVPCVQILDRLSSLGVPSWVAKRLLA